LFAAIQVKGEALLLVNDIPTASPLQIVPLAGPVMTGDGFTVTVKVCGFPAHPSGLDVGVIV
jgi:hypothetical protein